MHPRYEMIELQRQIDELKKEYGRLSRRLELLEQKPKRGRPSKAELRQASEDRQAKAIEGLGQSFEEDIARQVNL